MPPVSRKYVGSMVSKGRRPHARVEPVRQDQFDAQRRAAGIGQLAPFVHPRKAMQAPSGRLADGRGHRCRLQAIRGRFQALVVAQRRAAPDETQDLVGAHLHQPRGRNARIAGFHDLRGGPDQDVGIPDCGNAVLLRTLHSDGDATGAEVDRRRAARLRQREERKGHQVLACRAAPCRPAARGTGRAVRAAALVAAAGRRWADMAMATGEPEISGHHGSRPHAARHIPGRKSPRSCAGRPRHRGRTRRT